MSYNEAKVRTMIVRCREIRIRVSDNEKTALQDAARALGLSVCAFIRSNALIAAEEATNGI